jgi:DsrE/DsrF/DsrH-like protein
MWRYVARPQAVEVLRGHGFGTRRLEDGMPECRLAGLPVALWAGVTTTNVLVMLNDPSYGTERLSNGLRLAGSLAKRDGTEVRVFLLGDAVGCATTGQKVPLGANKVVAL